MAQARIKLVFFICFYFIFLSVRRHIQPICVHDNYTINKSYEMNTRCKTPICNSGAPEINP